MENGSVFPVFFYYCFYYSIKKRKKENSHNVKQNVPAKYPLKNNMPNILTS